MLIYKKHFQLSEGLSVSSYIQELNDTAFPPYALAVEKTSAADRYRVRPIFMFQPGQMRVFLFPGGMLFNDCIVQMSGGEREFIITGSIGALNLIFASLFILSAIFCLAFASFMAFTSGMSLTYFAVFVMLAIVSLAPVSSTFFREKKLLDLIGTFGS